MRGQGEKVQLVDLEGVEVERKIESIRSGFDKAAGSYRKRIDEQIFECFEVATYLWGMKDECDDVLDGAFKRHIQRRPGKCEALRFVLSKVRSDPKEASLYYRATAPLFSKDITLAKLSKVVTKAGGYRALASQHVKFPRGVKQQAQEISSDESDDASGDGNHIESKNVQSVDTMMRSLKGTEVLHCKYDGNGSGMTKLVAGTWFDACGHVVGVVDGRPIMEFFDYVILE